MDPKRRAAGWIDDPEHHVKPTKSASPVAIVLVDPMVDLDSGTVHGVLKITPHYPSQKPAVDAFLKGALAASVNPNSAPGTVEFLIHPAQPTSLDDTTKTLLADKDMHIEDLTRLVSDLQQELRYKNAGSKPETAKTDGDSGARPGKSIQQKPGSAKDEPPAAT